MSDEVKGCCAPGGSVEPTSQKRDVGHPDVGGVREDRAAVEGRMVRLAGGPFLMGTDYSEGFHDDGEGPIREVTLAPFAMDIAPVTNEVFGRFVAATGYKTEAERFEWSFVFWSHIPKSKYAQLVADTVARVEWWCKVPGARWDQPEGPGSSVTGRERHPVVHVSWNDAQAFCAWSGQRLPTEAEWEYAARGGLEQKIYPWGDSLRPKGEHRCNIWQGDFPRVDTGEDGWKGTCPVDAYPANGYGILSVTGNTWEWCADWFDRGFHKDGPRENPTGPPTGKGRVMKGGSFLCHKSYCNRYRVAARSSNTPDSSTSNMGFRCCVSL